MNRTSLTFHLFYEYLNQENNQGREKVIEYLQCVIREFEKHEANPPGCHFTDYARFSKKHLRDTILYLESLNDLRSAI